MFQRIPPKNHIPNDVKRKTDQVSTSTKKFHAERVAFPFGSPTHFTGPSGSTPKPSLYDIDDFKSPQIALVSQISGMSLDSAQKAHLLNSTEEFSMGGNTSDLAPCDESSQDEPLNSQFYDDPSGHAFNLLSAVEDSEYEMEIYQHLVRNSNSERFAVVPYIHRQSEITPVMRGTLINWMRAVCTEYRQHAATFFLAVNLLDRFLSLFSVRRSEFQLLGIVLLRIAAKFEEITYPTVEEYIILTENSYKPKDFITLESIVLNQLHFDLCAPTILSFLDRFETASLPVVPLTDRTGFNTLVHYLSKVSLFDYDFTVSYTTQFQALACVSLALYTTGKNPEHPKLSESACLNQRAKSKFYECTNALYEVFRNFTYKPEVYQKQKLNLSYIRSHYQPPKRKPFN